jgi:hypothetical protein
MNDKYYLVESILLEEGLIKLTKDIFKGGFLSTKFQLSLLYNVPKIIIKNLKSNEKSIKKTMNEINSFIDNKQKDIEKEIGKSNAANISEIITTLTLTSIVLAIVISRIHAKIQIKRAFIGSDIEAVKQIQRVETIFIVACLGIIAPALEEYSRNLAARRKKSFLFGHVINLIETLSALAMTMGNVKLTAKMRSPAIVMHYSASKIQKEFVDKGHPNLGFLCGFVLHASFNTAMILSKYGEKLQSNVGYE